MPPLRWPTAVCRWLRTRIKKEEHVSAPLHDDDPAAAVTTPAGVVRNLTAEEYAATYATGTPHDLPVDVEVDLAHEAARIAAAREG